MLKPTANRNADGSGEAFPETQIPIFLSNPLTLQVIGSGWRVNNLSFCGLRTRQSAARSVGSPPSRLGLGTVTYQFDGVDLTRERYD